jgi:hypothetical protein
VALVLPAAEVARRNSDGAGTLRGGSFVERLPPALQQLWASAAIFPAVFAVGFVVAFAVGAAALWGGPDPATLIASGRADEVLAAMPATGLSGEQLLWKGHALGAKRDVEGMLRAYQEAQAAGVVDERALQSTLDALGNPKASTLAVATLVDWKDAGLDETLADLAGDPGYARRHGALAALRGRSSADAARRLRAAVRVAVGDTRSDVCAEKAEGVGVLAGFVDVPAAQTHLKELKAWDAVLALNNEAIFSLNPCLDRALVKKTDTALGAAQRR